MPPYSILPDLTAPLDQNAEIARAPRGLGLSYLLSDNLRPGGHLSAKELATMTSSVLEQLVKRSRRLYSLPAVAMQVVELTNQPAIDTKALKDCVENDPALTTKILRVVNSSLFGLTRQVTDLKQALALIGTKPLKLLVLGFSLPKELLTGVEAEVLERYWRRTVIKAVAARELAETLWRIPGDDAFIAGLLQELGMLVLIQDLGETYLNFLDRIYKHGGNVIAMEKTTLGFDHAMLSARLLEHWGLPESIVRDVSRPFDIETLVHLPQAEQAVPQILHMADLVAEFLTRERASLLNELIDVGSRYKGVSISELEGLIASLELKTPQLADVLSLNLPDETPYSTILAQAYTQLCDASEAASMDLLDSQSSNAGVEAFDFGDLLTQAQSLRGEIGEVADSRAGTDMSNPSVRRGPAATLTNSGSAASQRVVTPILHHLSAPALLAKIETAVISCRQSRHALSLGLLELDQSDDFARQVGWQESHDALDRLQTVMHAVVADEGRLLRVDNFRFAVILEGCDRQPAVESTRQLVRRAREWSAERGHAFSVSGGVATLAMPPKNFPCQELIDAAERCLHGVQLSGGDAVKSIDIY